VRAINERHSVEQKKLLRHSAILGELNGLKKLK
jgi:hypothetical protein